MLVRLATTINIALQAGLDCQVSKTFFACHKQEMFVKHMFVLAKMTDIVLDKQISNVCQTMLVRSAGTLISSIFHFIKKCSQLHIILLVNLHNCQDYFSQVQHLQSTRNTCILSNKALCPLGIRPETLKILTEECKAPAKQTDTVW